MLLWLLRDGGLGADELERDLEHESGLRGLTGTDGDMREVIAAAETGDERARTALDVYVHRLRAGIAAMAAAMEGLDAVVFTGGVGEHSSVVRERACAGLGFLGVALDSASNQVAGDRDEDLSPAGADARVLLVESREDLEIADSVRRLLAAGL
jgi:acetate kinase